MAKRWGDRWENLRELKPGGQAHTFLVFDVNDAGKTVRVLKRLKNTSEERRARFVAEVEAIKRLNHPNIVKLIEHDLVGDEPYLVMEYCDGGSLGEVDLEAIPTEVLREYFAQICGALEDAHGAGLVHRDLKPDNIFLRTKTGPAVLGDFGLVFEEGQDRVTLTFEQVGSRFFMPPELRDGRAVGVHRVADIYSLGKVLYWMFSGGRVFDRENLRDSQHNLVNIRQDYYFEHLNRVLDKMIVYETGRRLERARDVAAAATEAWKLMDGAYNALSRPDQPCRYCGRGFYMKMSDNSYFNLGLQAGAINVHNFRILCCSVCGNLQSFWTAGPEEGDWITSARIPSK